MNAAILPLLSRATRLPPSFDARRLSPMLCAAPTKRGAAGERAILRDRAYAFELKLDGVRILAEKDGDRVTLVYRKGRDATLAYPEVSEAMRAIPVDRVVLDGEIVAFDETGRPNFQRLGRRIHLAAPRDVAHARARVPVVFVVFDALVVGDLSLLTVPLEERQALVESLVGAEGTIRRQPVMEDGEALLALCQAHGLEGVVAKKRGSTYTPGPARTRDWLKIKCERDAELVVVAWTGGDGTRQRLGALDVASYDAGVLRVRGRVGSGLDERTIDWLLPRLEALRVDAPTAEGRYEPKKVRHHVRPEIVVSVRYLGWSEDGSLRFPVFRGVRDDVPPAECTVSPREADTEARPPKGPGGDAQAARPAVLARPYRRVNLTNKGRVFFPDLGLTKGDVAAYYEAIAPTLLPYLADRPCVLVRHPQGIAGRSFHQWNVPRWMPSWMRTAVVRSREHEMNVFLIDDVDGLLFVLNLGAIPLHVTGGRIRREPGAGGMPDACDFFTLDFDTGDRGFEAAIPLARSLREVLDRAGLPSFPKTSGQTGLHVVIPLGGASFGVASALAAVLAHMVVKRHPDTATLDPAPAARRERVYIDTGQTHPLRTVVAPYALRADPRATVSTPVTWDELQGRMDPGAFTLRTVPERLARMGDPMRGLLEAHPDVETATSRLAELAG